MTKHGYLSVPDARAGQLRTNKELHDGIKMFQLYAGIPMTGVIDEKTMEMMAMPRCGMPDFGRSDSTKRKRRYAVQGTIWQKNVSLHCQAVKESLLSECVCMCINLEGV